jgi:hypothetical protein
MGAITNAIVDGIQKVLRVLFEPIADLIEKEGDTILGVAVDTPHPNAVFEAPTNGPWPALYEYYWETWIPMMLFLWGAMIGVVIFLESTSYLFGSYHRSKLKRRAFSGLLGLMSWWWIAALSLRFMNGLTALIIPNLSEITLFETLSFGAMGVLGLAVSLSVDLGLFILIGIIYLVRQVVLYLFILLMPLLIVFWIPGVGPFLLASRFMQRLAGFYVPFLFMTVPVALLFRLGEILGSSFGFSLGGFGAWILALIIPIVAVLSPFVLFWQAGAILFMAERGLNHASASRAQTRVQTVRAGGQQTNHAAGNFARGFRGAPAVRQDGQMLVDGSQSRAHAVGSRLRSAGSSLRGVASLRDGGGGGRDGGSGGSGSASSKLGGSDQGGSGQSNSTEDEATRTNDFSNLRESTQSRSSRPQTDSDDDEQASSDDRPRYIN